MFMSLPKYLIKSIIKISSLLFVLLFVISFLIPNATAHTGPVTTDPFDRAFAACVGDNEHYTSSPVRLPNGSLQYTCLHQKAGQGLGFSGRITNLIDPLAGNTNPTVGGIIGDLLPFIFGLAGMLTLLLLLWGGIRYMLARGDPKAIDEAKGTLTSAIIGLIIIILAVVIFFIVGESGFEINIFSGLQLAQPAYAQAPPADIEAAFPLASIFPNAGSFFTNIVRLALAASATLFLFMLIWGGFRFLNAGGNPDNTEAARGVLTGAFVGILIVATSFVIIVLIERATAVPLGIF